MKVQLLSKKFIKPSTPTPPNSSTHKLSFIDEHAPKMYIPLILYYPAPPNAKNEPLICNRLEKSLAQTLVQFYPLAGRYNKDLRIVDCNDEGAEFVEAKVDLHLHEILAEVDFHLSGFIPCEICTNDEITDPLLAIQVTMFKCGGLALGVCISHRIADASTLSMFLESWTSASNNQQLKFSKEISPIFESASFFPGRNYAGLSLEGLRNNNDVGTKIVTRRLLFDNKAISSLSLIAKSNPGPDDKPKSKVQLVNAVLWKAIASVERLKDEHSRAALILQPVNLREKTIHQVPKNCFGNLCLLAIVPVTEGEKVEIQDLAKALSGSIKWSLEEWTKIVSHGEDDPFLENLIRSLVNYYMITSWCRFPFYEAADFGWGKPSWASSVNFPVKNWIFLMDDKNGDGIEVWVNLDEKDMLVFEQACDIQALGGASARTAQNHQD